MTRLTLLLPLVLLSCIERPEGFQPGPSANRSGLSDVLLKSRPTPTHLIGAKYEGGIELIGYDATPDPVNRGEALKLTLYYGATEDVRDDWEVFIHLDDTGRTANRTIGDHFPANGRSRTTSWRKGDFIRDEYTVRTPMDATGLEFYTGFFQGDDRLTLVSPGRARNDGENRIELGTIALR